jgi:hypothetical protein
VTKEHGGGGGLKQTDADVCWMRPSLLVSVDMTEFQTAEAYSNLDLTNIKYSREENMKVVERIRHNDFVHS